MSATRLDRVFHERARLAICALLIATPDGVTFTQLLEACELTDGNLNRHLHALAEEHIVATERKRGNGRPHTLVRITRGGRDRFLAYIDALERIVRDVQDSTTSTRSPARTMPARSTSQ